MWDLLIVIIPGAFTTVLTIGVMHDTKKGPWNPRRKWGPQHKQLLKAKTALLDMSEFKKQRRIEDRQKWATEFEQLTNQEIAVFEEKGVAERYSDLLEERDKRVNIRFEAEDERDEYELERLVTKHPEATVLRTGDGKPIVILPAGSHPQPPRGPSSVSRPRITHASEIPRPAKVVEFPGIIIDGRKAEVVRKGKHLGCYVVHVDDEGDLLYDKNGFEILETWGDGHDDTCPTECWCPNWARRF